MRSATRRAARSGGTLPFLRRRQHGRRRRGARSAGRGSRRAGGSTCCSSDAQTGRTPLSILCRSPRAATSLGAMPRGCGVPLPAGPARTGTPGEAIGPPSRVGGQDGATLTETARLSMLSALRQRPATRWHTPQRRPLPLRRADRRCRRPCAHLAGAPHPLPRFSVRPMARTQSRSRRTGSYPWRSGRVRATKGGRLR